MHGEMKTSVLHGRFDAANVTQTHRRSFRSHERFHERARGSSCSPSTAHPLFPSLPSPSSIIPDTQRVFSSTINRLDQQGRRRFSRGGSRDGFFRKSE